MHVVTRLLRAGSEENVLTTCLGHVENGHQVTLVFGRDHDPSHFDKLREHIRLECVDSMVHPIQPLRDLQAVFALWRLFLRLRPDVVHSHQSKAGVLARLAARFAKVPHIVHGVHIAPFLKVGLVQKAFYLTAERAMASITDSFIDVSRGMRDAYLDVGIGSRENHHVVYSGMPLHSFIGADPLEDWRELLEVPDGAPKPPVVLMMAALESRKRHVELVERLAPLVARFPEMRVVFAGEGEERKTVLKAVSDAGLDRNVKLIGFHKAPEKLVALSDVCILTSNREGLPRVVVQYIAGGKPVVVTHTAGIEEIVKNGVSGFVTDADNIDGAVRCIEMILSDEDLRARLTAGALETDVSQWGEDALVTGTEQVYEALYSSAPARGKARRKGGFVTTLR